MCWNFHELVIFAFLSVNYIQAYTPCRVCTDLKHFPWLKKNRQLQGTEFVSFTDKGLLGCVKQCLLHRRCRSFNYDLDNGICGLNEKTASDLIETRAMFYSSIEDWPRGLAGVCANHNCSTNDRCDELNQSGTYRCIPVKTGSFQTGTTMNRHDYTFMSVDSLNITTKRFWLKMTMLNHLRARNVLLIRNFENTFISIIMDKTPLVVSNLKLRLHPKDIIKITDNKVAICDSSEIRIYLSQIDGVKELKAIKVTDGCRCLAVIPNTSKGFRFIVSSSFQIYLLDLETLKMQPIKLKSVATFTDLATSSTGVVGLVSGDRRVVAMTEDGRFLWQNQMKMFASKLGVDDNGFIFVDQITCIAIISPGGVFVGNISLNLHGIRICIHNLSFMNDVMAVITCDARLVFYKREG